MEHLKKPCNRCLKRVPMDFEWQGVWPGFLPSVERLKAIPALVVSAPYLMEVAPMSGEDGICAQCNAYSKGECSEETACCIYNEQNRALWYQEPPEGEGYQLWEITTEGSPLSPVFSSLEELCGWVAENVTVCGHEKASEDVWRKILLRKAEKKNDG